MSNYNTQNVAKAEEALLLASRDLIAFGKLFLPDDFMRSETPWFHYEMADKMNEKDGKNYKHNNLAIILPRGHGKTVLTKADILRSFCFAKDPLFYGWGSATQKLAKNGQNKILNFLTVASLFLSQIFQVFVVVLNFIKDMTLLYLMTLKMKTIP